MSNFLLLRGKSKNELIEELSRYYINTDLLNTINIFFTNYPKVLSRIEYWITSDFDDLNNDILSITLNHNKYSIRLSYTIIILISLIMDIKLTKGFLSTVLSLTGLNLKTISKIANEQKCIILEIKLKKSAKEDELIFYSKECIWNNIECKYRFDDICLMKKEEVIRNINELIDNRVIKKNRDMFKIGF